MSHILVLQKLGCERKLAPDVYIYAPLLCPFQVFCPQNSCLPSIWGFFFLMQ